MKIRITFKDPDGVFESIREAVCNEIFKIKELSDEEKGLLEEKRHESLAEKCEPWIQNGEYVTIEIDTEAKTAVVVKVKG